MSALAVSAIFDGWLDPEPEHLIEERRDSLGIEASVPFGWRSPAMQPIIALDSGDCLRDDRSVLDWPSRRRFSCQSAYLRRNAGPR